MRPNRNMTRMSKYGIELYSTLEAETGLATGWKHMRQRQRGAHARAHAGAAQAGGAGAQLRRRGAALISPREAGERWPLMRTDDLQGAIWIPGDGKANPADLCMSAGQGRARAARDVEGVEVTGVVRRRTAGRVAGVRTDAGRGALRDAGQLRRPVGAPVRRAGRRQRAAVPGRALLHRHRPHRGRAPRCCR
jgi:glycine/D-amino acid oxidase-like deaminating enzyme